MSPADNKKMGITRRDFFKGSAAGGAAGLVVGAGGAALVIDNKPWLPKKWDYEADIVVVGTGYAGQNAAIASHDAGADVLVLEKAPEGYEWIIRPVGKARYAFVLTTENRIIPSEMLVETKIRVCNQIFRSYLPPNCRPVYE